MHANMSYVYRLKGPHRWEGARDAIVSVDERVTAATMTRDCGIECGKKPSATMPFVVVPLSIIVLALFFSYLL